MHTYIHLCVQMCLNMYLHAHTYKAVAFPIIHPRSNITMAFVTSNSPLFALYEIPFFVTAFVHLCILYSCYYTPYEIHRVATPMVVFSSHHITSRDIMSYHTTPHHITSHHATSYHTIPYHTTPYHITAARHSTAHKTVLQHYPPSLHLPSHTHAHVHPYTSSAHLCICKIFHLNSSVIDPGIFVTSIPIAYVHLLDSVPYLPPQLN